MSDESILFEQGLAYAAAGQMPEAHEALKEVYRLNPARTDAICRLARIQREHEDLEAARTLLSDTLQQHPQDAGILLELGCLFHQSGQFEYALKFYRDALQNQPDLAEGWLQLGRLFQELGKLSQAKEAYEHALGLAPDDATAWNSLGLLHYFQDQAEPARAALKKAIELHPERAQYHLNLGMALLLEPLMQPEAISAYEMALRLNPAFAPELIKIGDFFMHRGLHFLARPFYACALIGKVERFDVYVKIGQCAERECEMQIALDAYRKALEIKPDQWLLQIRAGLLLPLIYQSPEDVLEWRRRFSENLDGLHTMVQREKLPRAIQTLSLYSPAFLLAYQGIDNSALLQRMSALWRQIFAVPNTQRNRQRQGRRRIGFVSAFYYEHSIQGCYLELIRELKRRGHEIYCFSLGMRKVDAVTLELQSITHWQTLATDLPLPKLAEKVISTDLDVVVYPEIGLDPLTYFLAHGRLAPVQVQLFGHPVSSGISTVDYFVSADLAEPEGAEALYCESLVRMPRSPFYTSRPPRPEPLLTREQLGLPDGHIYLLSGILFKLHPNQDALLAGILNKDPDAQIVMMQPAIHSWHDKLWQRLQRSLGPLIERVHFIPWKPTEEFYSLMIQADVLLDTLHFGAGNVAYQAVGLGVPVVTLPGSSLRSRTTFALYEQMGFRDLVADTPQEYIDLAVRLARDKVWQAKMRQMVSDLAEGVFEDQAIMAELAGFIEGVKPQ
ncbi:MAG: hypothetical protein CVV27_15470 [Candidatus Melainabacteria bacterium HGW-Melainabacteria-1]|nr:MAG: hypothetical protein CVV27_15470 [Candidatus Melainabacteria bacterium HGW-Melainabacteria-1]